jgi:shikimate kinase
MTHLKSKAFAVFLDADLPTLESRISDFDTRGLAKDPEQSFSELFDERLPLYRKYADLTIKCDEGTQEEVSERIVQALAKSA